MSTLSRKSAASLCPIFAPTSVADSIDVGLADDSRLYFGTDKDVYVAWDGTNLLVVPAADDSLIEIADAAATQKSFDLKWYGGDASGASYVYADASANSLYTVGVDVIVGGHFAEKRVVSTINTQSNVTLTTTQVLGGYIIRDPNGDARTDTTPTAAQLVAAMPNCQVGTSFLLIYKNSADAAETITIAGGTGVTVTGTATITQNNTKIFLLIFTDVTSGSEAATLYSIGTLAH